MKRVATTVAAVVAAFVGITAAATAATSAATAAPAAWAAASDTGRTVRGAAAAGFKVEMFIDGFPAGSLGPIGVAFDRQGRVFVADQQDGFLYRFGSGGGTADESHRLNTTAFDQPTGLAFSHDGAHLYLAERGAGEVVEVSPQDGRVVRVLAKGLSCPEAVAVDPKSGDLFISHTCGAETTTRIGNPASDHPTVSTFGDRPKAQIDGMTFAPDGTLFAEMGPSIVRLEGTRSARPGALTKLVDLDDPDGVGVSARGGSRPDFILVNQNNGQISKVDLSTSPPKVTAVFTGGSRGDFVAVGPDGCLYATQSSSVIRLRNADGSCDLASTIAFGRSHQRSSFPASIPDITEISVKVKDLVASALVLAVLVVLVTFPAELFNRTLEANYDEVKGWFGPLNRAAEGFGRTLANAPQWLGFGAFAVIATLITGFLDPGFGLDMASFALFVGLLVAFVAVTFGFAAEERRHMRSRHADPGRLEALPGTLLIAAVCVLVSRLVGFQPGYLYGIIAGFVFATTLTPDEEGVITAKTSLLVIAGSLVAWVVWTPVKHAVDHGHPNPVLLVVDALLAAVFVGGIESIVFGLIPLRFLEGAALWGWNRVAWLGVFALAGFTFVHVLLHPGVAYPESTDRTEFVLAMLLFVLFGAVSVGFWAWFRYGPPARQDRPSAAPADVA